MQGRGSIISGHWTVLITVYMRYLSFINPERGGFGVILPEVMIFREGLRPEGNVITEGNVSTIPRAESR